ncbi:hypothetical protein [Isoptericola sp. NPDC057191]|uniref:hypothetical protein n=1 Tax=Isoptericola sp. NPDC057191 TaxID=3346041 RepID=UPI003639369A
MSTEPQRRMSREDLVDALVAVDVETRIFRTYESGTPTFENPTRWTALVSVARGDEALGQGEGVLAATGFRISTEDGANLLDALDAPDADTAAFVPLVGRDADEWDESLGLEKPWGDLIIVDRVSVETEWQHLGGVGRYLLGLALLEIARSQDVGLIALHAHPYQYAHSGTDEEIRAGKVRLVEVWGDLGFEQFQGSQLMTIDPHRMTLPEGVERLRVRLTQ